VIVRRLDDLQRRRPALGFCYAVICKYLDDCGYREAALITYYGFLSLFPTLLLGVAIVSEALSRRPELRQELVAAIVPAGLQEDISGSMAVFSSSPTALVIGVVGLVFSGTGVVVSAYETVNHLAAVPFVRRFGVLARYLRVLGGLGIVLAGTVAIGALTVAASALPMLPAFSRAGALLGSCGVAFVVLVTVARPLLARPAPLASLWPAALPGAVAVTVVLNLGATVMPEMVRRAGPVYGAFATVAGFFTLFYLLSNVLVLAGEIAAVRHGRLWPRALDPGRPTAADARAMLLLAREQERLPAEAIVYVLRDPPAGAGCESDAGVKPPRGR
jgi:membrane protein